MKRLFSMILAVLLIANCAVAASAAGDFELRSGIVFGDTMDDILAKENKLERESATSNWFKGRIAGVDDSQCGFYFTDDGKLYAMDYSFDYTSRDSAKDGYKTLYESLVRKYGKAIGNVGGKCELITGPAVDRMGLWVYLLGGLDGNAGDYMDYDEWVIDTNGGHVKIDLISYYYRDSDYKYTYYVDVSYKFYTDADYAAARAEKIAERNEVDDDL